MKKIAAFAAALGLAASASAFAQKPQPMTDAQMDKVVGGALINVIVFDVADVNRVASDNNVLNNANVGLAIPVNAAVAVGVLGGAVAGAAQQPGNLIQRQ